jgi:hypothetical protein
MKLPGFQSVMGYDPQRKITVIVWTTLAPLLTDVPRPRS